MDDSFWFTLVVIAAGGVARMSKIWPKLPKSAVPWIALVSGFVIMATQRIFDGTPLVEAVQTAWTGAVAGAAAVGGHEVLKPLLARLIGPTAATMILGKLPKAEQ